MMPLQFPPTPASLLSRAYRPIVDESQEPRRAVVEPMVVEDAPIVRRLILATNIAAGCAIAALPFAYMLRKGWL
jgi:hypothetical protein